MLLKINPEKISEARIKQVVDCLKKGGVIIYPTDTVYAIGCDALNHKAVEKVIELKRARKKGLSFSFTCHDLSHLSEYASQVNNTVYKLMRHCLPGQYTFILNASSAVPAIFKAKKKTIGIRVPDNEIALAITKELGNPLLTTSLVIEDAILQYETDPEKIEKDFRKKVDMVVDGGAGGVIPSTVIDCTSDEIILVREGAGSLEMFEIKS